MALKTKTIGVGVVDILNINGGVTSNLGKVEDGNGVDSILRLSTTSVAVGDEIPLTEPELFTVSSDSPPTIRLSHVKNSTWSVGEELASIDFYSSLRLPFLL